MRVHIISPITLASFLLPIVHHSTKTTAPCLAPLLTISSEWRIPATVQRTRYVLNPISSHAYLNPQLQFILPIGFMIYQRNSEFMRYHSMRSPDPNATDVANLAPILEVEMPFALEGYGIPGNQAEQYSQLYVSGVWPVACGVTVLKSPAQPHASQRLGQMGPAGTVAHSAASASSCATTPP